jgi:hypothetical protein
MRLSRTNKENCRYTNALSNPSSAESAGAEPTTLAKPPTAALTHNAAAMSRLSARRARGLSSIVARELRLLNLARLPSGKNLAGDPDFVNRGGS